MKTNYSILKLALLVFFSGLLFQASAQTTISTLAEFTAANGQITSLTQIICPGKNVQLNVPASAGITYQWETRFPSDNGTGVGVPLAASNNGVLTDAGLSAGYYTYKLKATNNTTNCSEVFDQVVYVLPDPAITVTPPVDLNACTNVSENFAFTSAITGNTEGSSLIFAVDYQWYSKKGADPEVAIATATNDAYTLPSPTSAGTYAIYVKGTYKIKACTPTTSNQATVTIDTPPTTPVITISSN